MNETKLNYISAIRFLSKYIAHHKKNFIMFYFGWFFDMLLAITMPILFGIMIDEIVYHQNLDAFLHVSLVFVTMSVFSCLLYFLIYAQHQYLMSMYVYDIQRDIFRHLQKCTARFLSDAKSGDIISTIQFYSSECMHFVIRNIIHIINGVINLILLTIYIFIISPWIGLLLLAAVPISVYIAARFGSKIRSYSNRQRESYGELTSYVFEVFTAIRDIRLLGATRLVYKKITDYHRDIFHVGISSGISSITAQGIIDGTNLILQLAIFLLSAYLVSKGSMTIGLLTVVMTYFTALTFQVKRTSSSYLDAQNRIGYIQRIYDFMNSPTEDEWSGKAKLTVTEGAISFQEVAFAYQGSEWILKNVSLTIKPGERIAICGKSGYGKTTLGYLLLGFYPVIHGDIWIDGQRLAECSLKSIRQNIGMVSQDVLLFEGTIRENILLGRPGAGEGDIISAVKGAGIWEYISSLPEGLDTIIGVNGSGLSGGQKQRIAIARIYLKNPKIIIFDEATSALDQETEWLIHEAWEDVLKGRTSIIISHRQSSVMLCDRAAILEGGTIAEIGNPREMISQSKRFQTLFAVKEVEGLD